MTIQMADADQLTIEQMGEFLSGSRAMKFERQDRAGFYQFLERVLAHQHYARRGRRERGVVRQYLQKLTGVSRAQLTRLIGRWLRWREVKPLPSQRPNFPRRYSSADIARLARVDAAHGQLSGPAIRRLLRRAYQVFGQEEFKQLANLSVSHLYNLRGSEAYRRRRIRVEPTRGRSVPIAERRKPDPQGRPGYLRVDTVHQGLHDGQPGPYHINSVDTVTQWEILGCCEAISERYLLPVLEDMLEQYPFSILGFHCDNGSEFLNYRVAALLTKLLVEFTKSRPSRSTDNALVEGKNGAIVRKHMGFGCLPQRLAEPIQNFYQQHFNAYLNYHRPCGFALVEVNTRGKRRRRYPVDQYRTPYEKLVSLPRWKTYLKPGIAPQELARRAVECSDTQAALAMQQAKTLVFAEAQQRPATPKKVFVTDGWRKGTQTPSPFPTPLSPARILRKETTRGSAGI
jgi:hypothetical protein